MAVLNVIGQFGPLVGSSLFPEEEGPAYVRGMATSAGFMAGVAVLAGVLRWVLVREGRGGGRTRGYEGVGGGGGGGGGREEGRERGRREAVML